jgi:uncharacterized protein YbaR (Trm112 family)
MKNAVHPSLLSILVCPLTKTNLEYDKVNSALISRASKLIFPIKNGVPLLLEEEALPLEDKTRINSQKN